MPQASEVPLGALGAHMKVLAARRHCWSFTLALHDPTHVRRCPSIKAVKFHGNAEQREQQKNTICQPGKFDVVVTSYEMVIKVSRRPQWEL